VASAVGLSFKDTSTTLAVFAQNGLKGSDAGTSLKTMLMNLQPSTNKQVELFKKLGLTTAQGTSAFFNAQGRLKSMADIAGLLQKSMKNLTDAQRLQAMETLFGSDAIRAAKSYIRKVLTGSTKCRLRWVR
jgi:TP901 family phage tail tape measure protein